MLKERRIALFLIIMMVLSIIAVSPSAMASSEKFDILSFEDFSSAESYTDAINGKATYPSSSWEGSASMAMYMPGGYMRVFSGDKASGSQNVRRGAVNAWPNASKPYKIVGKLNMQAISGESYLRLINDAGSSVRTLFAAIKANDTSQKAGYIQKDTTNAAAFTTASGLSVPLTDWINGLFVLDVTANDGTNTMTYYINGVKYETNIAKDIITTGGYTKLRFQNGNNGQAYVDNIGIYYVYSDNLPAFTASYNGEKVDTAAGKAKIDFSNEIYIENFREADTENSVVKVNDVNVPMNNLSIGSDNTSLLIDGSLFKKGEENTVSIGAGVKDVLGTALSGETIFSVSASGQNTANNITMKAFDSLGEGYINYRSDLNVLPDTFIPANDITASSIEYDCTNKSLKFFTENNTQEQVLAIGYNDSIPASSQAPYTIIGKLNYTMLDGNGVYLEFSDSDGSAKGTLLHIDKNSVSITAENGTSESTKKVINTDTDDFINHKFEILYKIDVLDTSGTNKVTMWIDGSKYTSSYAASMFKEEITSMCFRASNGARAEIDNFEIYTMIGSKAPLTAVFDNLYCKNNNISITFSNEIAASMLANGETDSVITVKDSSEVSKNIPLDKISVSGDTFKTVTIDKSVFINEDGYIIDISKVKDINGSIVTGTTSELVSANELAKVSTTFDGIFVGGKPFSVTKRIRNFSSSEKNVNMFVVIYDKDWAVAAVAASDNKSIDPKSTEDFTADFGVLDSNVDETYKIKVFVWNENMHPYLKCEEIKEKYKQIAILKFDDFYLTNMQDFQTVKNIVDSYGVPASFGAMCSRFEKATSEQWATLTSWQNDGIELWHHGYASSATEYNSSHAASQGVTTNYDTMLESFTKGYDLFKNHGITFTTFGSPDNNADAVFVKMMDENYVGKINTFLLVSSAVNDANFLTITKRINIENPTGTINFESFKADLDADNGSSAVFIMQSHPSRWISTEAQQLKDAIEYAISKDVMFMTPQRYFDYQRTLK